MILRHHRAKADEAAQQLPVEMASLVSIVEAVDGLRLLGAMHAFDSLRRSSLGGDENFGSDAMLELLAGVVASGAEIELLRRLDQPFAPQVLFDVDAALRRIANLQAQIDFMATLESNPTDDRGVLNLLRMEHSFDRMSGFDTHLYRVASEVFDRVDDLANKEVGFRFSDALRFADIYGHRRMGHVGLANEWLSTNYPPYDPQATQADQVQWLGGHMAWFGITSAPPLELDLDEVIADLLAIPLDSFDRLVQSMSTTVGTARVTGQNTDNPTRVRPILALSSREWMWCRPVDFIHGVFDWALDVTAESSKLRSRFDKVRQQVAEQLPAQLLREVFQDRVHGNVAYPAIESDTELDILVTLPGVNLLVECKGGRFSPQGRRGAPLRVAKHADELITHAADQNARAAEAIAKGKPFKDPRGRTLTLSPTDDFLSIIVTFDRIDPFSAHLGAPSDADEAGRAWIVALADLVMLTEILPTPSEFYAYAKRRSDMVQHEGTRVWVEADALGAWCVDRLSNATRVSHLGQAGKGTLSMVSETSTWMNDYYSLLGMQRMGIEADELEAWVSESSNRQAERKPSADVPKIVQSALRRLLAEGDGSWPLRAEQSFAMLPKEWRILDRLVRATSNSSNSQGREARKKAVRVTAGLTLAGKVPVRVSADPSDTRDPDHLVLLVDDLHL